MFNEICIDEAKLTKLDEIEELMKEVAEFYLKQDVGCWKMKKPMQKYLNSV